MLSGVRTRLTSVRTRTGTPAIDPGAESRAWIEALTASGAAREEAVAELHALLLRGARFELGRRRAMLEDMHRDSVDDLAVQCADDALAAILRKLGDYRSESRFTTWAYKFVILEAAVRTRRRAWQERELPVDPESWPRYPALVVDPATDHVTRERLRVVLAAIATELTPHQREVLTALVLSEIPIDVLAERLNTTRGALYKTLHDARVRLRRAVGVDDDD
jgi:RNA polymerase sigma-70 factor (ECF subfamily)